MTISLVAILGYAIIRRDYYMPGFFMSNNKTKISISEVTCIYNQIKYLDYFFEGATLNNVCLKH